MKKNILFVVMVILTQNLLSQVGIGTTSPDTSSILDLSSNEKGFLPPRLTDAQRNDIANPAEGLIIYNIESKCLELWNGNNWINVCDGTTINTFHTEIVEITNSSTGRTWMDRNLGANQAATSSIDEAAFGDLYQWGRSADGHEKVFRVVGDDPTSGTFDSLANGYPSTAVESGDWDGLFITTSVSINSPPNNWLGFNYDNSLWQGLNGTNNPCPDNYRLPTHAELVDEVQSWGTNNNSEGAYQSIKLTAAGFRNPDGQILFNSSLKLGIYWSSTVSSTNIRTINFQFNNASINGVDVRAQGLPVRCIKSI